MEELIEAVDIILASPYPPSLQHLYHTTKKSKDGAIRKWASRHPERVHPLVQALLHHPSSGSYLTQILTKFCTAQSFRDSLLREDDTLLFNALQKALENTRSFHDDWKFCVVLVAYPLPKHVPLPDAMQRFLLILFNHAVNDLSMSSLEQLYSLLNGSCSGLLMSVATDELEVFSTRLKAWIGVESDPDGLIVSLYCLAIIAKIVCSAPSCCDDKQGTDPAHLKVTSMFAGGGAYRTITFACLQVISFCSGGATNEPDKLASLIRLARRVVEAIGAQDREDWMHANLNLVRKLQEKSCGVNLPVIARIEILAFAASLGSEFSENISRACVYVFKEAEAFSSVQPSFLGEAFSVCIERWEFNLDVWIQFFSALIPTAADFKVSETLVTCAWLLLRPDDSIVRRRAPLFALASSSFCERCEEWLRSELCNNEPMKFQDRALSSLLENELMNTELKFISFLIAFIASKELHHDPSMPVELVHKLLSKQKRLIESFCAISYNTICTMQRFTLASASAPAFNGNESFRCTSRRSVDGKHIPRSGCQEIDANIFPLEKAIEALRETMREQRTAYECLEVDLRAELSLEVERVENLKTELAAVQGFEAEKEAISSEDSGIRGDSHRKELHPHVEEYRHAQEHAHEFKKQVPTSPDEIRTQLAEQTIELAQCQSRILDLEKETQRLETQKLKMARKHAVVRMRSARKVQRMRHKVQKLSKDLKRRDIEIDDNRILRTRILNLLSSNEKLGFALSHVEGDDDDEDHISDSNKIQTLVSSSSDVFQSSSSCSGNDACARAIPSNSQALVTQCSPFPLVTSNFPLVNSIEALTDMPQLDKSTTSISPNNLPSLNAPQRGSSSDTGRFGKGIGASPRDRAASESSVRSKTTRSPLTKIAFRGHSSLISPGATIQSRSTHKGATSNPAATSQELYHVATRSALGYTAHEKHGSASFGEFNTDDFDLRTEEL